MCPDNRVEPCALFLEVMQFWRKFERFRDDRAGKSSVDVLKHKSTKLAYLILYNYFFLYMWVNLSLSFIFFSLLLIVPSFIMRCYIVKALIFRLGVFFPRFCQGRKPHLSFSHSGLCGSVRELSNESSFGLLEHYHSISFCHSIRWLSEEPKWE